MLKQNRSASAKSRISNRQGSFELEVDIRSCTFPWHQKLWRWHCMGQNHKLCNTTKLVLSALLRLCAPFSKWRHLLGLGKSKNLCRTCLNIAGGVLFIICYRLLCQPENVKAQCQSHWHHQQTPNTNHQAVRHTLGRHMNLHSRCEHLGA